MINDFNEYQRLAGETDIIAKDDQLAYYPLGLNGEAGEVADKVEMALLRGGKFTDDERKDLVKELGDVSWYIARLTAFLGRDMNELSAYQSADTFEMELTKTDKTSIADKLASYQRGISSNAGSVADCVKKIIRDQQGVVYEDNKDKIMYRLGFTLSYVILMADFLGYPMKQVMQMNIDKLASRKMRGVISGSGDNR